jgi:hypothetical protein
LAPERRRKKVGIKEAGIIIEKHREDEEKESKALLT